MILSINANVLDHGSDIGGDDSHLPRSLHHEQMSNQSLIQDWHQSTPLPLQGQPLRGQFLLATYHLLFFPQYLC